jgi:hypothetical protein
MNIRNHRGRREILCVPPKKNGLKGRDIGRRREKTQKGGDPSFLNSLKTDHFSGFSVVRY